LTPKGVFPTDLGVTATVTFSTNPKQVQRDTIFYETAVW
jgi:hypothetical protein